MRSPDIIFDPAAVGGDPPSARVASPAIGTTFSSPSSWTVELVCDRAGFDALAAEWLALEIDASGALVFQSIGWARAVFDFEARRRNPKFRPVIAVLRDAEGLAAILPLELKADRWRRMLVPLGDGFSQYTEWLVRPGLDPRPAFAVLLAALTPLRIDTIAWRHVRADGSLAAALRAATLRQRVGQAEAAPFVTLEGHPDFANYLQTVRLKTRKNIRNDWNRLERDVPLLHERATTPDAERLVIGRTMTGRADRLKETGLTSRAFGDTAFFDFCASLPGRDDANFGIMALSLLHGGSPISEQWGFVHNSRFYLYVTSRDFTTSDVSPGKLHMRELLATCHAAGLATADLMVPAMPYKLTWATGSVPVNDYATDLTWRGRLISGGWDGLLRPLLKRSVLALPIGPRTLLMRLAGRG